MKAYELLFFVDPSLDPETRLAVMKRIDTTIAEGAGKVDSVDEWGKRKLAYAIDDEPEGFASSPTRSTTSPMVTTPSSTSTQILPRSPSLIASCASPTLWSAT